MKQVCIPDGARKIGVEAYYNYALESIIIPSSVERIARFAFWGCPLKDIYFNGTIQQWNAIHKAKYWIMKTQDISVHCTDGTITERIEDEEE